MEQSSPPILTTTKPRILNLRGKKTHPEAIDQLELLRHPLPFNKSCPPNTIKIPSYITGLKIHSPPTNVLSSREQFIQSAKKHLKRSASLSHITSTGNETKTNSKPASLRSGYLCALQTYHVAKTPLEAKNESYWGRKLCRLRGWRGVYLKRLEARMKTLVRARLRKDRWLAEEETGQGKKEMGKAGRKKGRMDPELVEILRKKFAKRREHYLDSDGGEVLRKRVLEMERERRTARGVKDGLDVDGEGDREGIGGGKSGRLR